MSTRSNTGPIIFDGTERTEARLRPWPQQEAWAMEKIFSHHYGPLKPLLEATYSDGYLLAAVHDNDELTAHARLAPGGDMCATVIVGRHKRAHLQLDRDPTIALRHLHVRLTRFGDQRHIAVLDLKTGQGFELDGHGICRSAIADGALFLRIGGYALMLLPGSAEPWPDDPSQAWERVAAASVDDRRQLHSGSLAPPVPRSSSSKVAFHEISQIHILPGASGMLRVPDGEALPEETVGVLTVLKEDDEVTYAVTSEHLERGLLLGRYRRCDVGSREMRSLGVISRVHLLIIREGERILALDTASTNGTSINGVGTGIADLGDEAEIKLGVRSTVRWKRLKALANQPLAHLLN